jgi:hypothetical protein
MATDGSGGDVNLEITSVSPNQIVAGSNVTLTVIGQGFDSALTVRLCARGGVTIQQVNVID